MPSSSLQEASPDTKTALLDAAERLFAETGIAQSSLRAITSEAGANLASVNYHFGSKEGLVQAVFARRLRPLNRLRLDMLERCARSSHHAPDLQSLLRAFVEPAVVMMNSDDLGDRNFIKLLGRTLSEPTLEAQALLVEEFREVAERFNAALRQIFPDTPQEDLVWRFHFMVGALAHTVAGRHLVSPRLEGLELPDGNDFETLTRRLVDFLQSGWQGIGFPSVPADDKE
jgi:AcrR family transcriptional regulator